MLKIMELQEFTSKFNGLANKINIQINNDKIEKFYQFMNLMLEWNEKINLTAITEPDEVILKHFIDSLTIEKYVKDNTNLIDIGTGAGFPGIPISIIKDKCDITLMDSLNKRIKFLDDVVQNINVNNVQTVHARAEELAKNEKFREKYDYATSRAVASLNILLEYMLPFVKINGYCICMKGANIQEELQKSKNALNILGGVIENIEKFELPNSDITRNIIVVKKVRSTPSKYPRKAGMPSKEPLQ